MKHLFKTHIPNPIAFRNQILYQKSLPLTHKANYVEFKVKNSFPQNFIYIKDIIQYTA